MRYTVIGISLNKQMLNKTFNDYLEAYHYAMDNYDYCPCINLVIKRLDNKTWEYDVIRIIKIKG